MLLAITRRSGASWTRSRHVFLLVLLKEGHLLCQPRRPGGRFDLRIFRHRPKDMVLSAMPLS
jgi:hypothetical protein